MNECHICDKLEAKLEDIHKDVINNRVEIATLKVKSGVWGILGGFIPAIGIILSWFTIFKK